MDILTVLYLMRIIVGGFDVFVHVAVGLLQRVGGAYVRRCRRHRRSHARGGLVEVLKSTGRQRSGLAPAAAVGGLVRD